MAVRITFILCLAQWVLLCSKPVVALGKPSPGDSLSILSHTLEAGFSEAFSTIKYHHPGYEPFPPAAFAPYKDVMLRDFEGLGAHDESHAIMGLKFDPLTPDGYEAPLLTDTISAERQRAMEMMTYVEENKRFVETFDETAILDLPVGIKKTIGNLNYTIVIEGMHLLPDGTYLDAYMVFAMPQTGKALAFGGKNIKFSKKGGLVSGARLQLLGDHATKVGEETLLVFKGDGSTFIEWDCNGYKSMGIGAQLVFSRDLFLPDNLSEDSGNQRVTGTFTTSLSDWNDLLAEITITPFQVKGLKGFGFNIKRAVYDHSSLRMAPGMSFPKGYETALQGPLWEGVYIDELSVRLPSQFNKKGQQQRLEIGVNGALIDSKGFSGSVFARNLLANGEGKMDKWGFSVEEVRLQVVANQLAGAGFQGNIELPIAKGKPFWYGAIINPGNEYIFTVSPPQDESVEFNFLMGSKVEVYPSSYMEVTLGDGKFLPKAHLNGNLSIATGKNGLKVSSLGFEALELQTTRPYMKVGGFFLKQGTDEDKMGTFRIGINNIYSRTLDDEETALGFDAFIHLTGDDGGDIGGKAGLMIVSRLEQNGESQEWKFDRLEVSKIGVALDMGAVKANGELVWFKEDNTYGNGIYGEARLTVIDKVTVDAVALFGKKGNTRYWFADALATLPGGAGTGIQLKSFGGGAFYHMKQSTDGAGSLLGKSLSGIIYLPDEATYLGLKATVDLATAGSESVFNGNASLEISFNKGGGVRMVDFRGNGYFLSPPLVTSIPGLKERAGGLVNGVANKALDILEPRSAVSAHIHINYDVPNKTLHGNFETFVNVAAGLVKGIGSGNRAGWAVLHVSPDEWYIHIGSPTDPIGLQVLGFVKTKSYFMVGDYIPGSPAPPENVSSILGSIDLDYMESMNALGEGRGFAFGSRFVMDTGDLAFLMFYGRFAAGLGFDVMLKDYGSASCVGRDGPVGINGWYANGQAFAYFEGKIGIRVKLFGKRRKMEILSIGAAAILQAKLPNPFWMRGVVGGYFSVMNGLVKGNCKFEVTIGEDCKIVGGSVLESIEVIADVTPGNGEKDISVFNAAQGVFNMEVGKTFELVDMDDQKKAFRIKLDYFKVLDGTYEIPGTMEWNPQLDVVAYNPIDILPSEKPIKIVLQVSFEEKKSGTWVPVVVNGRKIIEQKEVTFRTGKAPDHIPLHNVKYSYPVAGQLNFHKSEYGKGYVKLKRGQPDLFTPGSEWKQIGRFRAADGEIRYFEFTHNQGREINFNLPSGLANDKIYAFEIINLPANTAQAVDVNVDRAGAKLDTGVEDMSVEVRDTKAEGTVNILQEKAIFNTYIQTSKYATFSEKVNAIQVANTWKWPIYPAIHELKAALQANETFDGFEVNARENVPPLIEFEASLDNAWFKREVKPLAYPVDYPPYGLTVDWRDVQPFGMPPSKALYIRQSEGNLVLTPEQAEANVNMATPAYATLVYDLPLIMYRDYADLRQKAAAKAIYGGTNSWMDKIIVTPFPGIHSGTTYKVKMRYVLPGINKITTEREINFQIN